MSKALAVLKLFFSLVSINSTESPSSVNNSTSGVTPTPTTVIQQYSFKGDATVGRPFRIPIPQDTLSSLLRGDISRFRFTMKTNYSGDISPSSWVQFDRRKREVYGFPLPGNTGTFKFRIIVSNSAGASLHEIRFELRVQAVVFDSSHEVTLKTGAKFMYINFMTSVSMRIDFVTRLARYSFNEKPSSIWIKNFNRETRELTLVFVNIPYSPCFKDTYQELKSKLVGEDSNIKPQFRTAMTETFPMESVKFRFFGACDPNMFGPEKPFEWGWLKHFIPLVMIFSVVGIPVSISCYVNRRRRKPPVVDKRRPRTLRWRHDQDGTGLTSHTVHFNNRCPSMLSVSNNSKEDNIGDDEKVHGGKSNISNGSPASRHLTVPNATPNRPRQGANSSNTSTTKNKKNPFKFASDEERANFDVRAMWDNDDDAEQTPLDIPTYYSYKSNEEEEPSILDAVFDMNFADIAENISTKLKGVKSMLNIQEGTSTAQERRPFEATNSGASLSTKLKGLGKSMLNLSTAANDPSMDARASLDEKAVSSLSTKLRDFGKSMLNLSPSSQDESKKDQKNVSEQSNPADQHSDSDYFVYKLREYDNARIRPRSYSESRRSYDSARQDYDRAQHGCDNSRQAYGGRRQRYDEATCEYSREHESYGDFRRVFGDTRQSHHELREDHNEVKNGYNDSLRRFYDSRQDQDFRKDITCPYELSRSGNRRCSETSEYELAQYNFQARRRSLNLGFHHVPQDHHDNYRHSSDFQGGLTGRRSSREHDFDEYPDSLFDATSDHSPKFEQERSIFDTDYCDAEDDKQCLVKPTPLWNHSPVSAARDGLGLTGFGMNDTKYQDYTNPHQYSNGPTRVPHSKSSYSALGAGSFSSQSTLDFWGDEGFSGKPKRNQSSNLKTDFFSSFTNSVPDLRRGHNKGSVPNGTRPHSKSKPENQKNSLLSGSLSLGEKPPVVFTLGDSDEEEYQKLGQQQQNHRQQQQRPEEKTSLVGLIKTGVSSILEPDGNMSKWFSGFQKNENPVT